MRLASLPPPGRDIIDLVDGLVSQEGGGGGGGVCEGSGEGDREGGEDRGAMG